MLFDKYMCMYQRWVASGSAQFCWTGSGGGGRLCQRLCTSIIREYGRKHGRTGSKSASNPPFVCIYSMYLCVYRVFKFSLLWNEQKYMIISEIIQNLSPSHNVCPLSLFRSLYNVLLLSKTILQKKQRNHHNETVSHNFQFSFVFFFWKDNFLNTEGITDWKTEENFEFQGGKLLKLSSTYNYKYPPS